MVTQANRQVTIQLVSFKTKLLQRNFGLEKWNGSCKSIAVKMHQLKLGRREIGDIAGQFVLVELNCACGLVRCEKNGLRLEQFIMLQNSLNLGRRPISFGTGPSSSLLPAMNVSRLFIPPKMSVI